MNYLAIPNKNAKINAFIFIFSGDRSAVSTDTTKMNTIANFPTFFIENMSDKYPDKIPPTMHPQLRSIKNIPISTF